MITLELEKALKVVYPTDYKAVLEAVDRGNRQQVVDALGATSFEMGGEMFEMVRKKKGVTGLSDEMREQFAHLNAVQDNIIRAMKAIIKIEKCVKKKTA